MKTKRHIKELVVWRTSFTDTIENIENFIVDRLQDEYTHLQFDKYKIDLDLNRNGIIGFVGYIPNGSKEAEYVSKGVEIIGQQMNGSIIDMFKITRGKDPGDLEEFKNYEELKSRKVTIGIKIGIEKF